MSDKDEHFCIVCKETIQGLMNYVSHRKNGCLDQKNAETTSDDNLLVCQQPNKEKEVEDNIASNSNNQPTSQLDYPSKDFQLNNNTSNSKTKAKTDYNNVSMDLNNLPKSADYMDDSDMEDYGVVDIDVDHTENLTESENVTFTITDGISSDNGNIEPNIAFTQPKEYGLLSAEVDNYGLTENTEIPDFAKKKKKRKRKKLTVSSRSFTKKKSRKDQNRVTSKTSRKYSDSRIDMETDNNVSVKHLDHVIKDELLESSDKETEDIVNVGDKHVKDLVQGTQHFIGEHPDKYMEKKVCEDFTGEEFENSLTCTVCDLTFDNTLSLLKHLFIIVKKDEDVATSGCHGDFATHGCHGDLNKVKATTSVHDSLLMKYLSFLSHRSPFQCDICQFYFNALTDFESHVESTDHIARTDSFNIEIKCAQCDLTFPTFSEFKRHTVDAEHVGGKLVVIDQKISSKINRNDNIVENHTMPANKNLNNNDTCLEHGHYSNELDAINKHSEVQVTEAGTEEDMKANGSRINELETIIKIDPDSNIEKLMNGVDVGSETNVKYDIDELNVKYSDVYGNGSFTQNNTQTDIDVRVVTGNRRRKMSECKHCAYVSDEASDMKYHYLNKHAKLTFKCDICDIVFLTNGTFRRHSSSKGHQANILKQNMPDSSQELFQCHVCKKKFTSENYCKFHTALQHFHLKSEECLLKYPSITRDKYADFLTSIAKESNNTKCRCPECDLVILKSSMIGHLRVHTGEQPFACKLCDEKFGNLSSLRRHLGVHFDLFSKSCEICGERFHRVEQYTHHLSLHKAQVVESKTHVCEICGASFYLVKQLRAHQYKHQEKTLKCDFPGCQWTFHNKHDLKMHKLTHSSDEKAFICATCGFTAKCRKYLKAHEKIHAKDVELLQCRFCDYKCRKTTHMRRHLRIHFGSKPYKCPYCSYACNTHDNIRKHILETTLHEGMKVYPCKFCEYSTNSTKEFRAHLMRDHSDLVGDGKGFKSLSSFTGLFVESEDLATPEEGMQIIPVNKRKNSRRSFQPEEEEEETVPMYDYNV